MAYYSVYWPQDWVEKLQKAGDKGPIRVIYGSIHSRMPTIASVKIGDVVFPVTLAKKKLYVMARLPVTHKECAFDYCMRELGRNHGSLIPDEIVVKETDTFYWTKGQSFNCVEAIPDGMTLMIESDKPHTKHQEPFNCCSEWAAWGENGSSIKPRPIPNELIPLLRFGYPKSKEKPLRLDKNGNVLSMSLTATRRMSEETAKIFEELF